MSTATDFIQAIIDNASLAKAREKVPGLEWGRYRLLRHDKTACLMGIAALAACETPESLVNRDVLTSAAIRRRGWPMPGRRRLKTTCPQCDSVIKRTAQGAIAHANDMHGAVLEGPRSVLRILRKWVKQELAAAKYLPVRSQRVVPHGGQPPAPEQRAAGESR